SRPQRERLLARVEQQPDAPRVRERQQHPLRLEAVGLVVALARHPALRVEVAVLARDELAEAVEALARRPLVPGVAGRAREAHELGQADEAERVQVLVRRRRLVGAARPEAEGAE